MAIKKGGLGKGLDAIFQENTNEANSTTTIKINEIEPNREQPRKDFDAESLSELAESIAKHGVIQPILVRPLFAGGYQIVAGERRWRASRMAGCSEIPVLIKEMDDSEYLQLSLIENLQREDLSPLEEASAFNSLIKDHDMTQEQVANAIGKSRPVIANSLRLLNLPKEVAQMLENKEISTGHARTLLGFEDEEDIIKMAKLTVEKGLTVRQLEEILKNSSEQPSNQEVAKKRKNVYYCEAELALSSHLGRKVKVNGTSKKATLQIEFYGEDDLKELLEQIKTI